MKVGIIADTHDNLDTTRNAVAFLEEQVSKVVHCGDMVAPFTAKFFDSDFDFYYVKGNNDGEWNLKETVEGFGDFLGKQGEVTIDGQKLGVYHGTEESIVELMVESGKYDYVIRGHTHEKKLEEIGNTVEINPGGIAIPGAEEVLHVAILDLETGDIEFHKVERL